ncbi:Ssb Single-stranded DNA-binding protein [uncultured Caudovirales phage]|uniref:Single-stranded DNA-binding protein n=1 Tax=uncultured Caudovirales phage TaxID=2100421 RepID=A0A6J5KKI9_9CAUD|nr:Ssb Single-stranded DNA-binding protein [uncultured Caudovirales phage]
MSNDLNRCEFIGRLGKDPELRYSPGGDAFCNFSIAVGWKSKEKEGAEWVRATAFGKLAEICGQYLKKGSQVYIAGRMTTRKWKNKEGVDQYSTEINVDQMQMLGGKSESDAPPVVKQTVTNIADIDDDSLPF